MSNFGENGKTPYERLKSLASQRQMNITDLLVMAPPNDPFYSGQPAQVPAAKWFARVWEAVGFRGQTGIHLRRFHYRIVSDDRRYNSEWLIPNALAPRKIQGNSYENTEDCWHFLNEASKHARHLGLVDADAFVDKRAPDPAQHMFAPEDYRPRWEVQFGEWELPEIDSDLAYTISLDMPEVAVYGYRYEPGLQPYMVEVWVEKSTMNDIIVPLCRDYAVNVMTGVGYMSISTVRRLLERIADLEKPTRILYVSDFDLEGKSMPLTPARQIEYALRELDDKPDIRLEPIILTEEQVHNYRLPKSPETGEVELDALEANHPGELSRIIGENISRFRDTELRSKVYEAWLEAQARADAALQEAVGLNRQEVEEVDEDVQTILEAYSERLADLNEELQEDLAPAREKLYEIRQAIENRLSTMDVDLPEPAPEVDEPSDEDWLFDARRDYLTQLVYYKQHQGKPMPKEKTKLCEECGREFHFRRKTAKHCSKACGLKAHRRKKDKEG